MEPPDEPPDETLSQGQFRARTGAVRFRLLVVDGSTSSMVDLPDRGIWLVGRAEDADLRVHDRSVSRRHARLILDDEGVRIADTESHNGVRVNGEPIENTRSLRSGDVVSLGEVALVLYSVTPEAPTPESASQGREISLGERTVLVADPAMIRLYELIRRLASSDLPVLILGESGAGKENAAFAVHHWSRRADRPFVALNCAAIAESLAESELFGHEKGAFTGAATAKPGLLETTEGGTLFLDELGELPLALQAKLLRALETRRILRVGGTKEREIDLRIVAATHRNLQEEVEAGRFRKDLYFRLAAASVVLPPLRHRPAEVRLLAHRFLAAACMADGRTPPALAPATLALLERYGWEGNVRELKSTMEYLAATVSEPVVEPAHLPERIVAASGGGSVSVHAGTATPSAPEAAAPAEGPSSGGPPSAQGRPLDDEERRSERARMEEALRVTGPLGEELRRLERERMVEALRVTGGVKKHAAALLKMPLRTFTYKCKQYGL